MICSIILENVDNQSTANFMKDINFYHQLQHQLSTFDPSCTNDIFGANHFILDFTF